MSSTGDRESGVLKWNVTRAIPVTTDVRPQLVTSMKQASFILTLTLLAAVLVWRPELNAETPQPKQRIAVDEIGRSIVLVGRLGVPLGEKVEISGYWHFPKTPHPKDGSIRFSVTSVNGTLIEEPIEFNYAQLRFTDDIHRNVVPDFKNHRELENQVWNLIAYETGRIRISPDEYRSESPVFPIVGMPYYTKPFTSEIVAVLKRGDGRTKP